MRSRVEFFAICARRGGLAFASALAAGWLAACTFGPAAPPQPPAPVTTAQPAVIVAQGSAIPPAGMPAATPLPPATESIVQILAYADRVRSMSTAELNQEVGRLGNAYVPANQVQLALVLSQLRQTPELIRAQEVLTRLLANPDAEAVALHPLARLLAARFGEQRRLEDQLEKQNQQTREVQRRLDQTNERLEALKAIERSLTSRPPPAPSAPASRPRAAPAP